MSDIKTNLYIEDANEYAKLPNQFKSQLNIQATYREEDFSIEGCSLLPKNLEIGIELTDLVLGIIKTVLQNEIIF